MEINKETRKKGLTSKEVELSRNKHGTNQLSRRKTDSLFTMFLNSFKDTWVIILCVALLLEILFSTVSVFVPALGGGNKIIEILSILIAVILATGFSTVTEYRNTSRSEALHEEYCKTTSKVIRDERLITIPTDDIVLGDVILLQAGDKVPTDGTLIEGHVKVSQAALNGESEDELKKSLFTDIIRKNSKLENIYIADIQKDDILLNADKVIDRLPFKTEMTRINGKLYPKALQDAEIYKSKDPKNIFKVFMGSVVTGGEAYMAASVIGDETELGIINKYFIGADEDDLAEQGSKNGKKRTDTSSLKLKAVATNIGKLGGLAALIAAIEKIVFGISSTSQDITGIFILMLFAEAVMKMASIVIMAVPEGLPMMNNLVQSMNTESLYKKNILVSHKPAFSDSAYMDILFTDKTGTITKGNLELIEFIMGNGEKCDVIKNNPDFIGAVTLNNDAKISEGKAIGSNNIDRALLNYAINQGFDGTVYEKLKLNICQDDSSDAGKFNSEKKCSTAALKDGSTYWKGATELVIDKITHYMDSSGQIMNFTEDDRKKLQSIIDKQSKRMFKMLSIVKITENRNTDKCGYVLYAVASFRDDIRSDAYETVQTLKESGIQVVMITGDGKETAVAIARESGIFIEESGDIALTHQELTSMSDDEIIKIIDKLKVVSRADPYDKRRLVKIVQSMDHVAGMTGDGINDAPALKQADVGFSMGDGTAVAQEAGDIVILNNSLSSIKDCVLNSRTMAKSVGKFLIFQLTVNVSTLLMNIIAPLLGWVDPFSIVEILWINLIMDTLAALAYGGEPILERYMKEKPIRRNDPILTGYIKSAIAFSSLFITAGSFIILENVGGILSYVTPAGCTDTAVYERTFMFAFFIYSIIFNSLNTRSETVNIFEHINENKKFIAVMSCIFIMQTLLLRHGGSVFQTVPLSFRGYAVSIGLAFLIIPADIARKTIFRKLKS